MVPAAEARADAAMTLTAAAAASPMVRIAAVAAVLRGFPALLSRASDVEADLLVMGAYSHSRVRELVLGGTTRTVLKSMTLPVLMAH